MRDYELTYLIKPDIAEEDIKNLLEKISSFIKTQEGIIKKATEPFKKNLGYQIKEKSEAFLVSIDFSLNPDKIKQLENNIKEEPKVLRHILVVKQKIKEITPRIKKLEPATEKPAEKPAEDEPKPLKIDINLFL